VTRITVAALLLTIPLQVDGSPCDASEKWEQAIAAKGGREKLESIRTFFWSGEMTVWHGLSRKKHIDQELYVLPNFAWSYHQNTHPGLGSNVVFEYLDRGYSLNTNDSPPGFSRPIPKSGAFAGYLAILLMETRWTKPKLEKCTTAESTQEEVIEALFNEKRYDFHFARGEQLPSRVTDSVALGIIETTFSGYKAFNGIVLPTLVQQISPAPLNQKIVLDLKMRYEINPEVPSGLIDSDPTLTMAPEGWRKVKSNGKTH